VEEGGEGGGGAFDLDGDAGGGVEDPAGERKGVGELIDEWAEAYSLDDATDLDVRAGHGGSG
jgi:hypothetical protein